MSSFRRFGIAFAFLVCSFIHAAAPGYSGTPVGSSATPDGTTINTGGIGGTLQVISAPTLNQSTTGSAATLTTPRAINGVNFDGSAPITITAAAGTLTGATLAAGVTSSSLTSVGTLASPTLTTPAINGLTTGTGVATAATASTLVARDVSGNFSAGTITAALTGNVTGNCSGTSGSTTGNAATATTLTTPRAINGTNFDGSAPITVTAAAGTLTGATLNATVTASSLTSVGTLASPTLTTPVINGTITGTGQATAATASTIAMRDSSANLLANNMIDGYRTTATAAGTTTLAVTDAYQQYFTGASTQTVKLPDTSTLAVGYQYLIVNLSTGVVTTQTSTAAALNALAASTSAVYTCISTAGNTAAAWSSSYTAVYGPMSVAASGTTPDFISKKSGSGTGAFISNGVTSGSFGFRANDATAQNLILTCAAQTVGSNNVTIPDIQGGGQTLICDTLTQTMSNKTLTSPTVNGATATTALTITQAARTSGVLPYIKYTIPTDTTLTSSTEAPGILGVTGNRQWNATGTVALQREIYFPGPTYSSQSASQTFTEVFNMYLDKPQTGISAIFTRPHTLGIVDSTSAASSITGAVVVATTLGTGNTSVGIGGGNISAGGSIQSGINGTVDGSILLGVGTGGLYTLKASSTNATPTLSLPSTTSTLVGDTATQTLTNKTFGQGVQSSYCSRLSANYTNATAAFTNTALSLTLVTGRIYSFHAVLVYSNSTAGEGAQFDFNGGAATSTNFVAGSSGAVNTVSTALTGIFTQGTVTGNNVIAIDGTFEPSSSSTFIIRGAEVSHSTGTLTLLRGSYIMAWDMP